jgi:hypothetical protein
MRLMIILLRAALWSLAVFVAAFALAYLVFGWVYGYLWTEFTIPDGQNGLGQFIALVESAIVAIVSAVLAFGWIGWRELRRPAQDIPKLSPDLLEKSKS